MEIMKELGNKYQSYIKTLPDMSGMDRALEHSWIEKDERNQAQKDADNKYLQMDLRLKQRMKKNDLQLPNIIARIELKNFQLKKYIQNQKLDNFDKTIAQELQEKCAKILKKTEPISPRDLGRIAWLVDDYSIIREL